MNVAFVFPGQGSQEVGMGRAMVEASTAARTAFEQADRALAGEVELSKLCFDGPLEALTLTANTQPAILATSIACLSALRERLPDLRPVMLAGHSLGEYSALVASGALDFADTLRLVRLRGQAMQDAVPPGTGSMAAIMGMEPGVIVEMCAEVKLERPEETVSPANFNAPGQVVIAGHAGSVARFIEMVSARKGRAIALKVSAPFHCSLMQPAADRLAIALESVKVSSMACPVVANVDAEPNSSPDRVKQLLVGQVAGAVRWEQCVNTMAAAGVERIIEIGPAKVLAGLIKRIQKGLVVHNVSDPASLDAAVQSLSA